MRFETKVGENGQITVPEELLVELHLAPDAPVEVELSPLSQMPAGTPIDWDAVHKFVAEHREPMIARMRAHGYNSVDEYIDDIRGR